MCQDSSVRGDKGPNGHFTGWKAHGNRCYNVMYYIVLLNAACQRRPSYERLISGIFNGPSTTTKRLISEVFGGEAEAKCACA